MIDKFFVNADAFAYPIVVNGNLPAYHAKPDCSAILASPRAERIELRELPLQYIPRGCEPCQRCN